MGAWRHELALKRTQLGLGRGRSFTASTTIAGISGCAGRPTKTYYFVLKAFSDSNLLAAQRTKFSWKTADFVLRAVGGREW